jgi:hypothetical protein
MPRPTDKPHARIYRAWMDLPSWTTLSPVAQALIVNLLTRYRPMEPNALEISDRSVTTMVNCARNTARKALADLVDRGWLSVVRVGRIRGPKARRASVYALTAFPKPPTGDIRAVNGSLQPPRGA